MFGTSGFPPIKFAGFVKSNFSKGRLQTENAMKIKKLFIISVFLAVFGTLCAERAAAQSQVILKATGNGEKVRLALGGKSKIVTLEGNAIGDFTAGGDPPHRYTTLLSIRKDEAFYLIAEFVSGAAIRGSNRMCGGDRPETLLLIQTDKNLNVKNIQTEIFASCIYNGAGRYVQGKMTTTKNKVSVSFDEGRKKYTLFFDANEAEKGLQLINR